MSDGLQEARALIKQAIAEIDEERTQLQSVLSAFGATASSSADSPTRKPRQRTKRRRRVRRGKRAARGQRAEQFIAVIAEKPGASVTEIARKLNVERTSLYPVAKKLRAEKRISKRGSGFAVRT